LRKFQIATQFSTGMTTPTYWALIWLAPLETWQETGICVGVTLKPVMSC